MAEAKFPMIYGLIKEAMGKIGAIGKDNAATNYAGKQMYKFRGIDAVYNALNPVMSELGLFIIPEVLEQTREERVTVNGEKRTTLLYSILKVKYTMYAPDGSSVSGTVIGEGMDSGDKASNKAMSIAFKYFCFQVFCIPTEEMKDPDGEVHEVTPERYAPNSPAVPEQSSPAKVSTAPKLPQNTSQEEPAPKPVNPVLKYIANEQAFMAGRLEISDPKQMKIWFADKRKSLIASKVVEDIPADKMTMEQAKQLVEAVYKTFLSDGGAA